MANILILFSAAENQTAKIAERIAEVLRARNHRVETADQAKLPAGFYLEQYDAVIIGASTSTGKYSWHTSNIVKNNLAYLATVPGAFFSVCLHETNPCEADRSHALNCVNEFLHKTGWSPVRIGIFTGCPTPHADHSIFKRPGNHEEHSPVPITELTNWEAVTRFAEDYNTVIKQIIVV